MVITDGSIRLHLILSLALRPIPAPHSFYIDTVAG
jgi:hypothetical protein